MKEVTGIRLCFENLETMEFKADEVGGFYLEDVQTSIKRLAVNSIGETTSCSEAYIELLPAANREHHPFGMVAEWNKSNTFKRIADVDDIASVEVLYEDGTRQDVYVRWVDSSEGGEVNKLQSSYLSKNGALYIYIGSKANDVCHVIDCKTVDNPDYAKYLKSNTL